MRLKIRSFLDDRHLARHSVVKRRDSDRAPNALGKKQFVQISLYRFEFRLGAGIIGSPKNRSNPM